MAFGIGMGPSGQENQQYNNLSGTSGWAANQGQQDISSSDAFMSAILSGDPTKIGQFLGPQERAIQGQAQQKKNTNAEFHNRSGGTNAQNQTIGDQSTQSINDMISQLTGQAVSGLSSSGHSLLNTGVEGFSTAFNEGKTMADQKAAKWNDIFNSAASVAAAPFTGGASLGMGTFSKPGGGKGGGDPYASNFGNPWGEGG